MFSERFGDDGQAGSLRGGQAYTIFELNWQVYKDLARARVTVVTLTSVSPLRLQSVEYGSSPSADIDHWLYHHAIGFSLDSRSVGIMGGTKYLMNDIKKS